MIIQNETPAQENEKIEINKKSILTFEKFMSRLILNFLKEHPDFLNLEVNEALIDFCFYIQKQSFAVLAKSGLKFLLNEIKGFPEYLILMIQQDARPVYNLHRRAIQAVIEFGSEVLDYIYCEKLKDPKEIVRLVENY